MTLQEAIEEVMINSGSMEYIPGEFASVSDVDEFRQAIATILNAVVKGELK